MTELLLPGNGFVFMKVGVHAQEPLEEIIARKTKEIENAGFALWGYGGSTCRPDKVQPFVKSYESRGTCVRLLMESMNSKHYAQQIRADQMSTDGINWQDIPKGIAVLGSRYALAINGLRREEFELPLSKAQVAIGNCIGRRGDQYIIGHVDKACFELAEGQPEPDSKIVKIGLVANLVEPYAVFLRNII